MKNARSFIHFLGEEKGWIKTTAKGNLPCFFIQKLFPDFFTEHQKEEEFFSFYKVLTEDRVSGIHDMRTILEMTGLIRFQKSRIILTKKGFHFGKEENARELFSLLFKTFFGEFNMSYIDCMNEDDDLQPTVFYTFFMINKYMDHWLSTKKTTELIVLPFIQDNHKNSRSFPAQVKRRVLDPLVQFGLLEYRRFVVDDRWFIPDYGYEYRKSPLCEKFFRFNIKP